MECTQGHICARARALLCVACVSMFNDARRWWVRVSCRRSAVVCSIESPDLRHDTKLRKRLWEKTENKTNQDSTSSIRLDSHSSCRQISNSSHRLLMSMKCFLLHHWFSHSSISHHYWDRLQSDSGDFYFGGTGAKEQTWTLQSVRPEWQVIFAAAESEIHRMTTLIIFVHVISECERDEGKTNWEVKQRHTGRDGRWGTRSHKQTRETDVDGGVSIGVNCTVGRCLQSSCCRNQVKLRDYKKWLFSIKRLIINLIIMNIFFPEMGKQQQQQQKQPPQQQ